ncbi:hypothetical protein F2Q68_00014105 [Brassica cretica]|uniref:TIR domain-containing protein n=1 Tax=Brassica cretica TaxID=69181 RepID=A0A8S9HFR4_BRACR|nr:hypothetical protein F2Q68_00014105 [Brassica cretica]
MNQMMKTGAVSDPRSRLKWDIFLSFQRNRNHSFTDRLDEALIKAHVRDSVAFIVILSPDYAKSRWCLDELAKLCDLRASLGRPILPIFYEVDPWHFRKQSPFEKGFEEQAKRFGEEEIERWRGAMNVIGHISSSVYRLGHSDPRVGSLRVRILRDVPQIKLVELNQSDTILDELNAQVSWTDTILDELSRTDTHFDKLSKQVQSSELVRPPEKLEMANLLSDEPTTNSIMPKVIIHVLNVQESLGLDEHFLFLVEFLPSKHSLFRWIYASYQATFRNPSFVGKQQLKSGSIKRLSAPLVSPFNPPVLPFGEFISP